MSDFVTLKLKADCNVVRKAIEERAAEFDKLLTKPANTVSRGTFQDIWNEIAALNRLMGSPHRHIQVYADVPATHPLKPTDWDFEAIAAAFDNAAGDKGRLVRLDLRDHRRALVLGIRNANDTLVKMVVRSKLTLGEDTVKAMATAAGAAMAGVQVDADPAEGDPLWTADPLWIDGVEEEFGR